MKRPDVWLESLAWPAEFVLDHEKNNAVFTVQARLLAVHFYLEGVESGRQGPKFCQPPDKCRQSRFQLAEKGTSSFTQYDFTSRKPVRRLWTPICPTTPREQRAAFWGLYASRRILLPGCNGPCRTLGEVLKTQRLTQESLSRRYPPKIFLPTLWQRRNDSWLHGSSPRPPNEWGKRSFRCRICVSPIC
jgi:hypothetical protein